MTDDELRELLKDLESDRCERKASLSDPDRVREAICAFANDLPDHRQPGVVVIGAKDDGNCASLEVTDRLLQQLADMRSDGNILPLPTMTVEKRVIDGCTLAVVTVQPSADTPLRFKGRISIRVGPRRAIASAADERILSDKRRAGDLSFDLTPVSSARLDDLDLDLFARTYLPSAVAPMSWRRTSAVASNNSAPYGCCPPRISHDRRWSGCSPSPTRRAISSPAPLSSSCASREGNWPTPSPIRRPSPDRCRNCCVVWTK